MLVGIDPLLRGEILLHLDRMGHSDLVVIADAHFPAYRLATTVVDVDARVPAMMRAVRTVLVPDEVRPLTLMTSGSGLNEVQQEIVSAAGIGTGVVDEVSRFDFYELAASALLIIRAGDDRTFANAILRKGVTPA